MNIQNFLNQEIKNVCIKITGVTNFDPQIKINLKKKDIDYQSNGIIKIAKHINKNPYLLAKDIISKINNPKIYKSLEASKLGFINIKLTEKFLCNKINKIYKENNFNFELSEKKKIIIDYSSPNIAKEMHIGHLRSTILGDVFVRLFKFLGNIVIKQNHIGDWGIPIGILLAQIYSKKKKENINIEKLYQNGYQKNKIDKNFQEKVQKYIQLLQNDDEKCLKIWKNLVARSIKKNQEIYNILDVKLKKKDIFGESFYKKITLETISDLLEKKIAFKKKKKIIVYTNMFKNRLGKNMGVVLTNKEGSFLYTATDISCVRYRYEILKADKIIYCTDIRQKQHFEQVFYIAKKAGYIPKNYLLEHYAFGMILKKDSKPFKTRDGNDIKLINLLNESIFRAKEIIKKKNLNIDQKNLNKISVIIGIGAIKYFDLSKNRTTNYIFDWDNMLSLEGNTALYIQYSYTRIKSILRKNTHINTKSFNIKTIHTKFERNLILTLLQFEETIQNIINTGMPHFLCNYLYKLSTILTKFYENCPVLSIKEEEIKKTRLIILNITAKIIKKGLNILGIKTLERM